MYIKIRFLVAVFSVLNTKFVQCQDDESVPEESSRRLKVQNREIYEVTDDKLRDYLGYYGNFIPEKDHNWCPKRCDRRTEILVSPNLSAYCSCNEKGETVRHQCKKFEIFNSTTSSCTPLLGNGHPTCVLRNKTCPSNRIGIEKHPNTDLYQNYIICMNHDVIVAKCEPNHYYKESQKSCVKLDGRKTILSHSDCHEKLDIKCTVAGITKLEKYPGFKQKNKCPNCYAICSEKDRNSFDLMIQCSKRKRVMHFLYIQPINDVLKIPEAVLTAKSVHHSEDDEESTETTTIQNYKRLNLDQDKEHATDLEYSNPKTDYSDKDRSSVVNNKQIITQGNDNKSESTTAFEGEMHGTVSPILKKKKSSTKKVSNPTILEDKLAETETNYNESKKESNTESNKSDDATASKKSLGTNNMKKNIPGPDLPILPPENLQETTEKNYNEPNSIATNKDKVPNSKKLNSNENNEITFKDNTLGTDDDSEILETNKVPADPILIKKPFIKKLIKKVYPNKQNSKNQNYVSDVPTNPEDDLSEIDVDLNKSDKYTTGSSDELIGIEKDSNKPEPTVTTESREKATVNDSNEDQLVKTIADKYSEMPDNEESKEDSPDELGPDSEQFESNENNPINSNKKQNIKKNNPKSHILTINKDILPDTSEENESTTISPDEVQAEEDSEQPTATTNDLTEPGAVPNSEIWENENFDTNSPDESMETEDDSKKLSNSVSDLTKIQDNLPKTTKDEESYEDITTDTSDELGDKIDNSPDNLIESEKDDKPNSTTPIDKAPGTNDDNSDIFETEEVSHKPKSRESTNDEIVIAAGPILIKKLFNKKKIKKVYSNKQNHKKHNYVSDIPTNPEDDLSEIDADLNKSDEYTTRSPDELLEKEKDSNKLKLTVTTDSSEKVDSIEDNKESIEDSQDQLSDKGEDPNRPKPTTATDTEPGANSEATESNKNNPILLNKKQNIKKNNPKSHSLTTMSKDILPEISKDSESTTISLDELIAEDSKQLKPIAATNDLTETVPKDPTTIINSRNGDSARVQNETSDQMSKKYDVSSNDTTTPQIRTTPKSIYINEGDRITTPPNDRNRLPTKPPRIIKKIYKLVEKEPNHYYEEEHPHDLKVPTEPTLKRKRKVITLIKRKLKHISKKHLVKNGKHPGSESSLNDSFPMPSKITQGGFSTEHTEMDATKNQNEPYTGKSNTNAILNSSQIYDNKSQHIGKKTISTNRPINKKNIIKVHHKNPMNFVLVDLEDVNNETIILEQHIWDEETIAASCDVDIKDQPCPDKGFYRFRGSCSIHYECYYKKECDALVASRLYQCPHCLQFNAKKQRCDSPQHVPECTYHEEDEQNFKGHRLTVPVLACTGPGIFKDPGNPNRYYKCEHIFKDNSNYLTLVKCPSKQIFSDVLKKCIPGEKKQRANRRIIEGGHENGSYVFDKYSCWRFFHNAGGLLVELHCPDGYIFNGKTCDNTKNSIFCNWEELKKYLYKR